MCPPPEPALAPPHPMAGGATIYHWYGGLLLLAKSLHLARPTAPIAATLRLALAEPYTLEVEGRSLLTRASLVASKRQRRAVHGDESDIALFYFPIEWPEYAGLRAVLEDEPVVEFPLERFGPVLPTLRQAFDGQLSCPEIKALAHDALKLVTGDAVPATPPIDARILKVCKILAHTPLNLFNLDTLAAQVHLSPSRLRMLFKEEIGHPISEYARWAAVWQAVELWRPEATLTEAALKAGFFDLAHANKAIAEVFGISPSLITDQEYVQLVHCD